MTTNGRYPGAELYDALLARSQRAEAEVEYLRSALGIIASPGDSRCAGCALIAEVALAHHPTPQAGEQEQ